jgi:hypothetical protein
MPRKTTMAAPVSFSRWLAGPPTTRAMLPVACAKSKDAETARDAFTRGDWCVALARKTGTSACLKELYK